MTRSRLSLLVVALSVAILGGLLGKWAIDHRLPWQNAKASGSAASQPAANDESNTKAIETQQHARTTFLEALRTAETAVNSKAYGVEQETEDDKPVIEVDLDGKEVYVDAVSGEIVLIEDLREKGDPEDIQEITEALKLQKLATIPIQQALQTGERFAGDRAHTVALKNVEGSLVYEVVIGLQEIYVDAGNGQILFTKTIGQTDKNHNSQQIQSILQGVTH